MLLGETGAEAASAAGSGEAAGEGVRIDAARGGASCEGVRMTLSLACLSDRNRATVGP